MGKDIRSIQVTGLRVQTQSDAKSTASKRNLTVLRVAAVLRELRAVQRPAVLPLERRGPGRVRAGGGAASLRDGVVGVLQHERHTLAVDEPKDLRGKTRQDSDSISVVENPFVDNLMAIRHDLFRALNC